MKKTSRRWRLAMMILLASSVMLVGGCAEFLAAFADSLESVDGTVVDGRSGGGTSAPTGVSGVTVTLTPISGGTALTATTSSTGRWSVEFRNEGLYRMTAARSGWFFIPQTVNLSGWANTLPNVVGIQTGGSKGLTNTIDSAVSIIVVWNASYQDIDGYITFTEGEGTTGGADGGPFSGSYATVTTFTDPYEAFGSTAGGFGPGASNRERVSAYDPDADSDATNPISYSTNTVGQVLASTETTPVITLDRDDRDGNGPEVITVNTIPVWPTGENAQRTMPISATASNGLPTGSTYLWTGVMAFYVDGWNKTSSSGTRGTPDSAHYLDDTAATVYVAQGSTLLGEFPLPSNVNARTFEVLRINTFITNTLGTYMQILPNVEIYADYTKINAVGPDVIGAFGVGRSTLESAE